MSTARETASRVDSRPVVDRITIPLEPVHGSVPLTDGDPPHHRHGGTCVSPTEGRPTPPPDLHRPIATLCPQPTPASAPPTTHHHLDHAHAGDGGCSSRSVQFHEEYRSDEESSTLPKEPSTPPRHTGPSTFRRQAEASTLPRRPTRPTREPRRSLRSSARLPEDGPLPRGRSARVRGRTVAQSRSRATERTKNVATVAAATDRFGSVARNETSAAVRVSPTAARTEATSE